MQAIVERDGIAIDPAVLKQAGAIVARKQYRLIKQRGYRATMLGGGARGTHHFTDFVGGDMHITMNWSTIRDLNARETDVVPRIDEEPPARVVEELSEKIPCWRQAYEDDGLAPEEFDDYPPLQRFRRAFVAGCENVHELIDRRRKQLGERQS
jgi:transaldolase